MDDEQLRQYALEARSHPRQSPERQLALTRLVEGIFHSGRLCYPRRGQFRHIYDEIRNEAIQNLFFFICNNIDRYQPERAPVMRWANYLLACRFFEEAIGIVLGDPRLRTESVDNYDRVSHTHRDREPSLSQLVKQCLEEDVNGKFKNKCVKNNPQANFKEIAKRRLLKQKWKDIATDLGVRASTLSDFYQRCLVEFSSEFKDYIQN